MEARRLPDEQFSTLQRQLAILQEYLTLKFGSEFEEFYKNRAQQAQMDISRSFGIPIQLASTSGGNQNQEYQYYFINNSTGPNAAATATAFISPQQASQSEIILGLPNAAPAAPAAPATYTPQQKMNSNVAVKTKMTVPTPPSAATKKSPKGPSTWTSQTNDCPYPDCNKTFRRYKLLENHIRLTHEMKAGVSLTCSTPGCKLTFTEKQQLVIHEQRCGMKPHKCKWAGCEKTFRTSKLLHGHISAVHRRVGRDIFKCSTPGCLRGFPDSTKLKIHEDRCKFRQEMENEDALVQSQALQAAAASTVVVSSRDYDNPMNMTMSGSGASGSGGAPKHNINPVTIDLSSFFVKEEIGRVDECYETPNNM